MDHVLRNDEATLVESHSILNVPDNQPEFSLFDLICENFCEECRILRWLGKANPPMTKEDGRSEPSGQYKLNRDWMSRSEPQFSSTCEMCQLIRDLAPRDAVLIWIDMSLRRLSDLPTTYVRANMRDPYDVLELIMKAKVHGREAKSLFNASTMGLPTTSVQKPGSITVNATTPVAMTLRVNPYPNSKSWTVSPRLLSIFQMRTVST